MKKGRQVLRKLTSYVRLLVYANPTPSDLCLLAVAVLAAIASGVPFPVLGILFGQLIDDINSATCNNTDESSSASVSSIQSQINEKVLIVVYIGIGNLVLIYVYIVAWNLFGERLARRLRSRYFQSLLRQDASFFDDLSAGEVSARLDTDIRTIQQGTSEKAGIVLNAVAFFITAYTIALMKDAKLGGQLVSLVPAFLFMSLVGGHFVGKYTLAVSGYVSSASSIASEALSNILVVQAFSANGRLEKRFANILSHARLSGIKKAIATSVQSGLLYFIAYSANALAYWQGSRKIAEAVATGEAGSSVGTTYTVIFILVDATLILSAVAPFIQIFGAAESSFERLSEQIEHRPLINDVLTSEVGRTLPQVSGDLKFQNVMFTYPSRPEKAALQNLNLHFPAGKHTAIVGASGCGKSTVASLITRLYDPVEGTVTLDSHVLRNLDVNFLRSCVSLVQQESPLLDRSILENIAMGLINSRKYPHLRPALLSPALSEVASAVRDGATLYPAARKYGSDVTEIVNLVLQASQLADASHFINRLKHGFGTSVGTKGTLISGGQKQRISIARALVKDPDILVLDEATASLDSASEARIQDAMVGVAIGRTMVTVAHRLSTIRNADNIVVMREGKVLEQGTHQELMMKEDGVYRELVRLQDGSQERQTQEDEPASSSGSEANISIDDLYHKVGDEKQRVSEGIQQENSKDAKDDAASNASVGASDLGSLTTPRSLSSILRNLFPFFRRHIFPLLLAFLAAIVVGSTYSASATIFGHTVGALSPCNTPSSILSSGSFYALMFFVLAVIEFFANFASWSGFGFVAEKILFKVRVLSLRSLLEQDVAWHQSHGRTPTGLLGYITKDGDALGGLTGSVVGTILSILVNLLAAVILTHVLAWKIALVCLAAVPVVLGAGVMQMIVLGRFEARHREAFARSVGITVEAVENIRTVAALGLEDEMLGTYHRSLKDPIREITRKSLEGNVWLALAYGLPTFVYALAYWWGSKRILAGEYSQVQFFIVLIALLVSAQLWGQMFTLAPDVSRAKSAVGRILNLLDLGSTKRLSGKIEEDKESQDVEKMAETSETARKDLDRGISVSFKHVRFSYPARPDIEVLHGLDMDIQPGQFCAIMGASGAGKSTIIALLERMYSPRSGSILIDNHDISSSEGVAFRNSIALVPQDSVLFEGTIRFNVSLGAVPGHDATDDEVEEACQLANIHETIMALPNGYDTNIGPNGSQLSGGQKQRLAIARALVRKPRLLLLDEYTSALDADSERLLQEGLEKVTRGITVVAIAHRLNTIRRADVIYVLDDGRCVDRGTHEDLMGRCEIYRAGALHQGLQ